jgi:Toastrack DUF4097
VKDLQREILSQVAAGKLTAEEGAARLEALESAPAPTATPSAPPAQAATAGVGRVKVVSRFGNTEVVGDATIASAVAEGPHSARQEGDTLVIEQSPVTEDTSFEFSRPPGRVIINGFDFGRKLTVRMNPSLPLAANVQAGNLRVVGVHAEMSSEVQAGNCTVTDFRGPIKLTVAAGNINASGRLDSGVSAIRCEMGQVKVSLDRGSDVRIKARTTMGKVSIEGAGIAANDSKAVTIGSGAANLDIDCTMGNVKVSVE